MFDYFDILINSELDTVIKDPKLTIQLIKIYSLLYANGSQVSFCNSCLAGYLDRLKKDGMEKMQKLDAVKNRTCVPGWVGLRYISKIQAHVNPELLTDELATMYLINSILSVNDFKKLPDSYIEYKTEKQNFNPVVDLETVKEVIKEDKAKTKGKEKTKK